MVGMMDTGGESSQELERLRNKGYMEVDAYFFKPNVNTLSANLKINLDDNSFNDKINLLNNI